jgi:formate dehydrogenase iron-sulfur subunit
MCHERQVAGDVTACAEVCPTEATLSGEYDELVTEARRRISENPDQYFDKIYGLEEAGGTSGLMIAAVPLEQLGMPSNLPLHPLPMLTWRALTHVPDVVAVGAVLLGGVWWITHRREDVAAAEGTSQVSTERLEQ